MRLVALLILSFVLLSLAVPVLAAPQCGRRDGIAAALARQSGEAVQVWGLTKDGLLMEIWPNPETGTWTATMTSPDGITCQPAEGQQFQIAKPGEPA